MDILHVLTNFLPEILYNTAEIINEPDNKGAEEMINTIYHSIGDLRIIKYPI